MPTMPQRQNMRLSLAAPRSNSLYALCTQTVIMKRSMIVEGKEPVGKCT